MPKIIYYVIYIYQKEVVLKLIPLDPRSKPYSTTSLRFVANHFNILQLIGERDSQRI